MKKIRWATHKNLFSQIASSSCLLAVSAGVVFGVSAGTFKIEYLNLNNPQARLKACIEHNYYNQNIKSQWNMFQQSTEGSAEYIKGIDQPASAEVDSAWWEKVHPGTTQLNQPFNDIDPSKMALDTPQGTRVDEAAQKERTKYSALVIDGPTHTALDRSFNQGLYNGLANFNTNVQHDVVDNSEGQVFKPSQDSTQEFVNIYRAVAAKSRVLALAGFNHVTPLNALGKRNAEGIYEFADKNIANAGMMLMDGDVSNNQNVASVLFRSDQPAFLTALATCIYFYNNLDIYHDNYQDISVATYGGTAIPTVVIYMGGFQRGVEFFNRFILLEQMLQVDAVSYIKGSGTVRSDYFEKKLLPASKYKSEVEELKNLPAEKKVGDEFQKKLDDLIEKLYNEYSIKMIKLGDFGTHFSGSFAAGDAIGISKQYLNRGASAILAVAGPQSLDSAQEIMNQNSKCIIIGVDSAMERSDYQKPFRASSFKDKTVAADGTTSSQASNIIKFSAVKDMTNVSDKILRLAATGKHWDKDSTSPWMSAAVIPSWTVDEEVPFKKLNAIPNDDDGTYSINGFIDEAASYNNMHVLNIPTVATINGKQYKLKQIYGFNLKDEVQREKLNLIDTLKISGSTEGIESITFGYNDLLSGKNIHGFDYTDYVKRPGMSKPGIKYIDFSEIPCEKLQVANQTTYPFYAMSYTKHGEYDCKAYKNGLVKFYPYDRTSDKENAWSRLFNGVVNSGTSDPSGQNIIEWARVEPDPYSSICSFGFKTCGNIENGLISISWDGWPLLIDALKHCTLLPPKQGPTEPQPEPFENLWIGYAKAYATAHQLELDEDFYDFLHETDELDKYSTFDTNSILNKNYSHLMTILGKLLNRCTLAFHKDMTVLFDKNSVPYLPTENYTQLTILDWLKYNMYFTL